jgi:hypothetical protein
MNRVLQTVLAATLLAAGCTTLAATTRLSSALRASEFNTVASAYMERPTFVSLESFSDKNTALKVEMDEYGTGYDPLLKIATPHATYFDKRYVADYLALIDKYFEWEALAAQRGDLIERDVGGAKTWGVGGDIDLRFSIFSSSSANHLLVIERCAFGTCVDKALNLTRPNAAILRTLLTDFADGGIAPAELDSVYK